MKRFAMLAIGPVLLALGACLLTIAFATPGDQLVMALFGGICIGTGLQLTWMLREMMR